MNKVIDMAVWLRKKNMVKNYLNSFDEEEKFHKKFLEDWEALYPSPEDTTYTLVTPDRTDTGFKELRDELDKQGIDYKVVSTWVDPLAQEEE